MLLNLHVKNLALIDEADVYFDQGLNILTGETGAGKSIIIGSINVALGAKVSKDMIRRGENHALVELVFQIEEKSQIESLKALDVSMEEDGQLIISRKIMGSRSISKVNGEVVPISILKSIGPIIIDIHGQHDHQSLLHHQKHLEILDEFAKKELDPIKRLCQEEYQTYFNLQKELKKFNVDEETRAREISFLNFEIDEIENAQLRIGEDEELEVKYKKLVHSKRILDILSSVYEQLDNNNQDSVGEVLGRASRDFQSVVQYDKDLENLSTQLMDIDSLLADVSRELMQYLSNLEFEQEDFSTIEKRLDTINHLKSKYGQEISTILEYKKEKEIKLEKLMDFENQIAAMKGNILDSEERLEEYSHKITQIRKKYATKLEKRIVGALIDLNFLEVRFQIAFTKKDHFSANGYDEVNYMISTNPGEDLKPLNKVASGGELSRIMLAIKTILADQDEEKTLIFDEIDVGISGRTAQKVSEKLFTISRNHQVICITHLPQIASMADEHYIIEKEVKNKKTITSITPLKKDQMVTELARMLGGAKITDAVYENAKEMKYLADLKKS